MYLWGSIIVGWGGGKRGHPHKQGLLNHLPQREHLAIVFGLDRGDDCDDRRYHHACYRLLEGGVHSLRVSYDFLKPGNCFRKLVCVCDPGKIVKTRRSGYYYSCFSFGDVEKRGIYWLSNSYVVNELLQGGLDARSLLIACVTLKLMDGTDKVLGFRRRERKATV